MVTTTQIAKVAKVSVPVVSKVLNGGSRNNSRVSEAKRLHVLQVAEQLGYRPNTAAHSVRRGRFNAIGLLMSEHPSQSTVFGEMLRGIHEGLDAAGYHLTVNFIEDRRLASEDGLPKVLGQAMVDGMILNYTHGAPPAMVEMLRRHKLPTVWLNAKRERNCVYVDDFAAARDATRRLLGLGHQRIMYADFTGRLESADEVHYSRIDRRAGYEAAMREADHEPLSQIAQERGEDAVALYVGLLRSPHAPTAVVTYGPPEASAFSHAAYACGLALGRELRIATFAPHLQPAGPSVDYHLLPERELGHAAAEALLRLIRSGGEPLEPIAVPLTRIRVYGSEAASA